MHLRRANIVPCILFLTVLACLSLCVVSTSSTKAEASSDVSASSSASSEAAVPSIQEGKAPLKNLVEKLHEEMGEERENSTFAFISNVLSVYALPSLVYSLMALIYAFLHPKLFKAPSEPVVTVVSEEVAAAEVQADTQTSGEGEGEGESTEVSEEKESAPVGFSFEHVSQSLFWTNIHSMIFVALLQWTNSLFSGVATLSRLHATHKNGSIMTSHMLSRVFPLDVSHLFAFVMFYLKDKFKYVQIFAIYCHFVAVDLMPFPVRIIALFLECLFLGRHYHRPAVNTADDISEPATSKVFDFFDKPLAKLYKLGRPVAKWLISQRFFLVFVLTEVKTFRIKNPSVTASWLLTILPIVFLFMNIFQYKGMKSLADWTFVGEHRLPFITIGYFQDTDPHALDEKTNKDTDKGNKDNEQGGNVADKTSPSGDKVVTLG